MAALPVGRHFKRGDEGCEPARRGTVWNQRVPDRYPEVIVQAVDTEDIVAALRYAKTNRLKVNIRSGGPQLGGQPPSRWGGVDRRQADRPRRHRCRQACRHRRAGQGRQHPDE